METIGLGKCQILKHSENSLLRLVQDNISWRGGMGGGGLLKKASWINQKTSCLLQVPIHSTQDVISPFISNSLLLKNP